METPEGTAVEVASDGGNQESDPADESAYHSIVTEEYELVVPADASGISHRTKVNPTTPTTGLLTIVPTGLDVVPPGSYAVPTEKVTCHCIEFVRSMRERWRYTVQRSVLLLWIQWKRSNAGVRTFSMGSACRSVCFRKDSWTWTVQRLEPLRTRVNLCQ